MTTEPPFDSDDAIIDAAVESMARAFGTWDRRPAVEPPFDALREMRRTVRRMRYWVLLPSMVVVPLVAAIAPAASIPGLLVSAGALGASWTITGWVPRDDD